METHSGNWMRQNWFPADKHLLITLYYNCATALPEKHFISLSVCCVYMYMCVHVYVCSSMMQACVPMWKSEINAGHFPQPFLCFLLLFVCLLYGEASNVFWEVKKKSPCIWEGTQRDVTFNVFFFEAGSLTDPLINVGAHWFSLTAQATSSWDLPCLPPCVFIILLRLGNAAGQELSHGC